MENDPLKHIFSNFDPELTPGDHFTQRVADSLKAVEWLPKEDPPSQGNRYRDQ